MNDRELLELAAKAVCCTKTKWVEDGWGVDRFRVFNDESMWIGWNPLTDDGDALRLAATLFQCIEYVMDEWPDEKAGIMRHKVNMPATRRFIVEAAAKIGEAMP